ncbi:TLR4 interactor with leucine rich repeats-like [Polyodon spathula]|uniref:TLR4 interactor with leucine rich repeats-like n=1 Tax=Polyodon spathula TaxID=7913 RepID=UPI001B7DFA85|nr:TLR4 interactor with leucine rich repeats-like [Polyodon spathula]
MTNSLVTFFLCFYISVSNVLTSCPGSCKCQDLNMFCANGGLNTVPEPPENASVKYLGLGGNFINSISAADFTLYTGLKRLDLQYNSIATIPYGTFESLGKVNELYLGNNRVSQLKKQTFTGLISLHYLDLSNNRISTVMAGAFYNLESLTKLRLSGNALSAITDGLFVHLQKLEFLHFENNRISTITRNALKGLGNLIELNFTGNKVTSLIEGVFRHLPALSNLQLDKNNIAVLRRGVFKTLTTLHTLSLSHNGIFEIDPGAFAGLARLTSLKLNGNCISTIGPHFLSNSPQVEEIDLSHNQISIVNENAFENVPALNILKLNDNKLTYLNPDVFSAAAQLSSLKLNDNPWQCNCELIHLKDWLKSSSDRLRVMTVFIKCAEPKSLMGKYLDFVSNAEIKKTDRECADLMPADDPGYFTATHAENRRITHSKAEELKEIQTTPTPSRTTSDASTVIAIIKNESKRHIIIPTLQDPLNKATPQILTTAGMLVSTRTSNKEPQTKGSEIQDACFYNQFAIINISADEVTSSSARIKWGVQNNYSKLVYFRIMYDQFDRETRFSRFINIKQGHVCDLRDLRPSTPYFICVESVVNERVCHVASRDLCVGVVTKDEISFPPDPQAMILYFSVGNAVALLGILVVVVSVIIYKNNKKRSTESVMYCQNRNDTCTVCAGFPLDYNCGYNSNSSRTGTYQANEIDVIDLPRGD